MTKPQRCIIYLLAFLPTLNLFPYAPYGAWTAECIAFVLLGAWLTTSKPKIERNFTDGQLALIVLIGAFFLSYIISRPSYLAGTLTSIIYLLAAITTLGLVRDLGSDKTQAFTVFSWGLVTGGLLHSLIGLTQITPLFNLYAEWAPQVSTLLPHPAPTTDIFGLFYQKNLFADYLFLSGIAVCYLRTENKISLPPAIALLVIIAFFVACSGSRSPLLFIAGCTVILLYAYKKAATSKETLLLASTFFILTITLQFALPLIGSLFSDLFPNLPQETGIQRAAQGVDTPRLVEWQKAIHIFINNPFFGIGAGAYGSQSSQLLGSIPYPDHQNFALFTHCHNLFLQIAAEIGLIGLLALVALTILCIRGAISNIKLATTPFAAMMAMVVFCHSQVEFPLWYSFFLIPFFFCVGFLNQPSKILLPRIQINPFIGAISLIAPSILIYSNNQLSQLTSLDNREAIRTAHTLSLNPLFEDKAELFLIKALPTTSNTLDYKLFMAERLYHYRPSIPATLEYSILLMKKGQRDLSLKVINKLLKDRPRIQNDIAILFIPYQNQPELQEIKTAIISHLKNNAQSSQ